MKKLMVRLCGMTEDLDMQNNDMVLKIPGGGKI